MVPVFKNVGERATVKNYCPVTLLSVVSKVFQKLVNNRIVDHLEKCGLFLISSIVFGLLNQLQIFSVVSHRIASVALDISMAFDRVLHAGLLMEFQVRYLDVFLLFSVIDSFEWIWMESLHKNIQLMLEFHKAPSLVLYFSCYTLMTFLIILSVILLSMLMILLSILSVF